MTCGPKVAQFGGIIKKLLVTLSACKATPSTFSKNFNIKNQLGEGGREIRGAFTTLLLYTFLDHANHSCFPPHPVPRGDSWNLYERRRRAIPGARGPTCVSLSVYPKTLGRCPFPTAPPGNNIGKVLSRYCVAVSATVCRAGGVPTIQ
jgi:hypothetical protein